MNIKQNENDGKGMFFIENDNDYSQKDNDCIKKDNIIINKFKSLLSFFTNNFIDSFNQLLQ